MAERIMYVCTICADDNPEMCGYCDRNDLRALPDGRWVCDGCFDDCRWDLRKRETEDLPTWFDFPPPPEYAPAPAPGIEARSAETEGFGPKDESPKGAQNPSEGGEK